MDNWAQQFVLKKKSTHRETQNAGDTPFVPVFFNGESRRRRRGWKLLATLSRRSHTPAGL